VKYYYLVGELGSRIAAAMPASNLARASSVSEPRFTKVPTTGRIRWWWTTSSATMSSGSASKTAPAESAASQIQVPEKPSAFHPLAKMKRKSLGAMRVRNFGLWEPREQSNPILL
jgi:hypothetical protein